MKTPLTLYLIWETLKRMGPLPFIKGALIFAGLLYLFKPEALPKPVAQTHLAAKEVVAPASKATTEDLRVSMTSAQSAFYWKSFEWMMAYGPELQPKTLNGGTVLVTYVKDAALKAENGLTCRPFAEKLIVAGQYNIRKGVGCVRGNSWCRQMQNEQPQCRTPTPTGFEAEMGLTLQNMRIDWDRNLNNYGM